MRQTTLSKYLISLQMDFKLIQRIVPLGQNPHRSKKGIYMIGDNLLAFWFSHVYGKIQQPDTEALNAFVGKRFELICADFLMTCLRKRGEQIIASGRVLENQVFLDLRRHGRQVYYYKGKGECDFVVREGSSIVRAIQVCYDLDDNNRDREFKGMIEAMETFNLQEGLLLTSNQDDEVDVSGKKIVIKPVWKWSIEQASSVQARKLR